jgi:hypothetical protein
MPHCKLCEHDLPLSNSHIIPEFAYRSLYEAAGKKSGKDGKFFPIIMGREVNSSDFEQKGYRQALLCSECEGKFAKWENHLRDFLVSIQNKKNYKKITLLKTQLPEGQVVYEVEGFNYHSIRMALLSILWRLSISDLELFKSYSLGKAHSERIKHILFEDQYIPEDIYPVYLAVNMSKGVPVKGLQKYGSCKRIDGLNAQIFTMCATDVITVVSNQKNSRKRLKLCIREDSSAYILEKEVRPTVTNNSKILDRLMRADIGNMYDQLTTLK